MEAIQSKENKTEAVEKSEPNRFLKRNIGEVAIDSKINGKIQCLFMWNIHVENMVAI